MALDEEADKLRGLRLALACCGPDIRSPLASHEVSSSESCGKIKSRCLIIQYVNELLASQCLLCVGASDRLPMFYGLLELRLIAYIKTIRCAYWQNTINMEGSSVNGNGMCSTARDSRKRICDFLSLCTEVKMRKVDLEKQIVAKRAGMRIRFFS